MRTSILHRSLPAALIVALPLALGCGGGKTGSSDGTGGTGGGDTGGTSTQVCGDGKVTGSETCDDGNTTPGDGCSATCQTEVGYACSTPGSKCQKVTAVCGDGVVQFPETCDDGNTTPGDGCSATCQVERGFGCSTAGAPCQAMTAVCGDGIVTWPETCDDGNTSSGDGCSKTCQIEAGYTCPTQGKPCQAMTAVCGDGIVTAPETCDDGNTASGDGCSGACQVENGWTCGPLGGACHQTICGDGKVEGKEQCDDGNTLPFDGCDATCHKEVCTGTSCTGFCGDGIVETGEECDDGNNLNGDGCSADCKLEHIEGIACTETTSDLPKSVTVPVMYRDFKGAGGAYNEYVAGSVPYCTAGAGPFTSQLDHGCAHPDFETFNCDQPSLGLVNTTLGTVASRKVGVPVFNPTTNGKTTRSGCSATQLTSAGLFSQWYTDVPGVNRTVVSQMSLSQVGTSSTYVFDNTGNFFPLDSFPTTCSGSSQGCIWGIGPGKDTSDTVRDFGFTSEVRYPFTYQGNEVLNFAGDDDVWVFINGKLALDLGGLHSSYPGSITLTPAFVASQGLGLVAGNIYEMALFHAERHTSASNFKLTLGGFVKRTTVCKSVCGDGVKAPDEECDQGAQNGQAGASCSSTCTWVRAR